jgi:dTDP-4-amino-4,6-dideoxygalactose transaminase
VSEQTIPLLDLKRQQQRLRAQIDANLMRVLDHGQYVLGPEVGELETRLADFVGGGEAVGVSSGRDALIIALMAEGIGPGDAVFVPAFTFIATAEVVAALGATPVFVDVDPTSYNLDPAALEAAVAEVAGAKGLRPRAVIPVDLFGQPADYGAITAIAEAKGLFVLADAAQSFGGELEGRRVGRLAPVTATSFYPSKPLGGYGDGGCLFTEDAERAATYRSLRGHGFAGGPEVSQLGMTGRLDTLQAAVLLPKLAVFAEELAARRAIAARYDAALADSLACPTQLPGATSAWAHYSITCDDRDGLSRALGEQGIGSRVYYAPPLHLHPVFAAYSRGVGSLPVAEALSRRILSLPLHPYMRDDEVARVCAAVVAFCGGSPSD